MVPGAELAHLRFLFRAQDVIEALEKLRPAKTRHYIGSDRGDQVGKRFARDLNLPVTSNSWAR